MSFAGTLPSAPSAASQFILGDLGQPLLLEVTTAQALGPKGSIFDFSFFFFRFDFSFMLGRSGLTMLWLFSVYSTQIHLFIYISIYLNF